jgi:hypothetical protein
MKVTEKSSLLEGNLDVVLCGCETLSIIMRENYIFRVFNTGILRNILFQFDIYCQIHSPCLCHRKPCSWEQNFNTEATLKI